MFAKNDIRTYEKFPLHGFISSSEIPLHIGLGNANVDSVILIWPDNSIKKLAAGR